MATDGTGGPSGAGAANEATPSTGGESWLVDAEVGDFRLAELHPAPGVRSRRDVVDHMTAIIDTLGDTHHGMLTHCRGRGASGPLAAHVAAGETGDQHLAYGRNRSFHRAGFIRYTSRGKYEYTLPDLVDDEYTDLLGDDELREMVAVIGASFVEEEADGE